MESSPPGLPTAQADASDAGLHYVLDSEPGIVRRRAGKGFRYLGPDGAALRDDATLARIRKLAIPPAYTDVWICRSARGHLQATGRDARGRKQYRYHPRWQALRGEGKFARLVEFGRALPRLRRRVRDDLKRPGLPREKVQALVVSVMARTLFRIGNDEYARSNGSYGLTTLRDHHVAALTGGRAHFRFRGKSGLAHEAVLDDARLTRVVRACQELPGQTLFQYVDDDGAARPLGSQDINDYLSQALGPGFTAKDFRTWGATLHAFWRLSALPLPEPGRNGQVSERAFAKALNAVIAEVAQVLGNTPAVCRKAYVDPRVLAAWQDGRLHRAATGARGPRQWEQALLRLLGGRRG
jgi:DNA topoisomerase-1